MSYNYIVTVMIVIIHTKKEKIQNTSSWRCPSPNAVVLTWIAGALFLLPASVAVGSRPSVYSELFTSQYIFRPPHLFLSYSELFLLHFLPSNSSVRTFFSRLISPRNPWSSVAPFRSLTRILVTWWSLQVFTRTHRHGHSSILLADNTH